jgi:hypothetical protein
VAEVKKPIDWEAVEREYRAGIRSLKDIGSEFGVSDAGIIKRSRKDGWTRDLAAKIKAKAESLVSAEAVSAEVSAQTKVSERQIVDANAEMMAGVIRSHHRSLGRLGGIIQLLFDRLESELTGTDLFSQLGEMMQSPDDSGNADKLNDLYRKVISLPSQTDTAKKLAETLKTQIELERKVFKIEEAPAINPAQSCISVEFVNPPIREDDE